MYQKTIQSLTTIFAFFTIIASTNSQNAIYSFTFDSDLDGWTTVGVSSADTSKAALAVWAWTANGDAGTGAYNSGETPIGSESGGGAMLFDSDGLDNGGTQGNFGQGPSPSPQRGELISPSLDFTGQDKVILAFHQYYRYFSKDDGDPDPNTRDFSTPATSVEVSNDGGTSWTSYLINEDIAAGAQTRATDKISIDITDIAANQADVTVKFVWDGEYYFWIIDDVSLYDSRGVDLAVIDFTNIDNFETPDFALVDSVDLEMMVHNKSDSSLTDSIMFLARILESENLDLIYSDTGWIEELGAGDTVIWDFDNDWLPEDVAQQGYFVVYNVRYRGDTMPEIVAGDDNVDFNFFDVRDFSFRKVPPSNRSQGSKPVGTSGDDVDYDIANIFFIPEAYNHDLKVDRISFKVCSGEEGLAGKTVIGFIAQLPDTARVLKGVLLNRETDLIGLDASQGFNQLLEEDMVIGIGSKLFTSVDDAEPGCPEFFIDTITNLDGDAETLLEPGGKYLVGIRYSATSNDLFMGVNEDYKLWQLSTIVSTPDDATPGWSIYQNYEESAADIGLELTISTAVDENPLPENSVNIYPNPADEYVRIDIDFETPKNTSVFLADANGKIINVRSLRNTVNDQVTFDMTRYPSGFYIIRVATAEGTMTREISVVH